MRITIIGGAYGSGKTEFAVNYAKYLKQKGAGRIGLVDLDIVNPYFRSRELTQKLAQDGITVVSSELAMENIDIPALSPRIFSVLQDHSYQVVFDVGGDSVGARALGRFNQYFQAEPYDFWVVLNPFRPDTKDANEAAKMIEKLESAARIQATGLIANINLGRETTLEIWHQGLAMVNETSTQTNLPIVFQVVEEKFLADNTAFFNDYPVFSLQLNMLPPWLTSE